MTTSNKLNPHLTPSLRIEPGGPHLVGGEWSHHYAILAPLDIPILLRTTIKNVQESNCQDSIFILVDTLQ